MSKRTVRVSLRAETTVDIEVECEDGWVRSDIRGEEEQRAIREALKTPPVWEKHSVREVKKP